MKKMMTVVFALVLMAFAGNAFAEKDEHYMEIKKYKDAQRAAKKSAPAASASHEKTFWEKEGERSGLGESGGRMGNFLRNMNPVPFFKNQREAYEARKSGGVK